MEGRNEEWMVEREEVVGAIWVGYDIGSVGFDQVSCNVSFIYPMEIRRK